MIYKHSDLIGSITGIVVPDGISEIEDETFAGCTLWGSVNFSGDIKSVGNASFNFCFKLQKINLPDTLTEIGDRVFHTHWQKKIL